MKNLKKLISVIVTVAMLISSFAALTVNAATGEYGDVEATSSYYKAIKVLSGLGVVKGDEVGNFNPTNDIKRSEMVALVCRAVGEESVALSSSAASFDDVAANHWAAGYIAWGVASEIVNGVGDNKFDPDAPVKFQDAVVMVLRALGYDRIAQKAEYGGYPTGYLKIASQRGVLAGTNYAGEKEATREVVAQVIYNGLTAPLVDISYFAPNPEDDRYTIFDGRNGNELRTLLTWKNEIYKVKAVVDATDKTDVSLRKDIENPMVKLDVIGTYDEDAADLLDGELLISSIVTAFVGDTEVSDYLGYTVEAYIVEDDDLNDWKIAAAVVDTKSVVTETIVAGDVTSIDYDNTTGAFTYYATPEASRTTKIDVDYGALKVYYNGKVIYDAFDGEDAGTAPDVDYTTAIGASDVEDLINNYANIITFLGQKNADYDKIFVTDYDYYMVEDVNVEDKYITFVGGGIDLDADSRNQDEFVYNLYDAEGNAIDLADVKEDDLLNIVAPLNSSNVYDLDTVETVDIYVTNDTVEGMVTEENLSGVKYTIDGDIYETMTSIAVGDEGIFYLTIDGLVFKADTTSSISNNYAFIVNGEDDASFGEEVHYLQLFTAEGKLETYTVASTLKVTGQFDMDGAGTADTAAYGTDSIKRTDGTQATFFGTKAAPASGLIDALYADKTGGTGEADAKAALQNRIITYKLNADGEINAIVFAKSGEKLSVASASAAKYYDDTEVFANEDLDSNSKLFEAPVKEITSGNWNVDKDDLRMASFSALDPDDTYYSFVYTIDNHDFLGAAIVAEEISSAIKTTHLAVVKARATGLNAAGDDNVKYTFVQSGEVLQLAIDVDADGAKVTTAEENMAAGDVFRYTVNSEGEIDNIELVYDASAGIGDTDATNGVAGFDNQGLTYALLTAGTNKIALVAGEITDIEDGKMTVETVTTDAIGAKLKLNSTEGNTYASVDEAIIQTTAPQNGVKALSGYGNLRASVGAKTYFVIATVGENNRFEDCVMIIK